MRNFIKMSLIRPGKLDVRKLVKSLHDELGHQARIFVGDLNETTATWKGPKPTFKYTLKMEGGDLVARQVMSGDPEGIKKWNWLNYGTSIRWALMSGDWGSKTSPGTLRSSAGAGRVVIKGRGAMTRHGVAPRPGIEARDWIGQVSKKRGPKIVSSLYVSLDKAAGGAFKGGGKIGVSRLTDMLSGALESAIGGGLGMLTAIADEFGSMM